MKKAAYVIVAVLTVLLCSCGNTPSNTQPAASGTKPSATKPAIFAGAESSKPSASPSAASSSPSKPPASPSASAPKPSSTPSPSASKPSASPSPSASASKPSPSSTASQKTQLTTEDLEYFTEYFAQKENNGFLLSSYSKPSEIDLKQLFYFGAGTASEGDQIGQAEADAFMKAYNLTGIEGDFMRLTTKQINDFLKIKMGITLSDVKTKMGWLYLKQYDAYYTQVFDTNYGFFDCVSGYKTGDGTYVVTCQVKEGYGQQIDKCEVTLKKSGESFLFVSNKAHATY